MPKERALIDIRLAGLSQGVHEFDFTCNASDFNDSALEEAGFTAGISARVLLEKGDNGIAVSLETAASAVLPCNLCLAPVHCDLHGSWRVYYTYDPIQEPSAENAEEYREIDRNTVSLDLTEDVRETLLLSVPMRVTCTDNPGCHVFQSESHDAADSEPDGSWQESLGKLKNKFR